MLQQSAAVCSCYVIACLQLHVTAGTCHHCKRVYSFMSQQQAHVIITKELTASCHGRHMSSLQRNLQSQACLPLSGSPVSACSNTPSALAWHHQTRLGGSTAWHRQCTSAAAASAVDHALHHCKPQSQMCCLIPTPLLSVCTLERWSHHAFMSGERDVTCACRLTSRFNDKSHLIKDSMNACFCFPLNCAE